MSYRKIPKRFKSVVKPRLEGFFTICNRCGRGMAREGEAKLMIRLHCSADGCKGQEIVAEIPAVWTSFLNGSSRWVARELFPLIDVTNRHYSRRTARRLAEELKHDENIK